MRSVLVVGLWALVGCGGVVSTEKGDSNRGSVAEVNSGNNTGGTATQSAGSVGSAPSKPLPGGGSTSAGPGTPSSGACWSDSIPAEPQPAAVVEPDFDAACQAALSAPAIMGNGGAGSGDAQGLLIGRFQPCAAHTLVSTPHDAIEFGGNRRYRLLARNPVTMSFDPSQTGYFYFLGGGQLNLGSHESTFLEVLEGAQAFRVGGAIYARIPAAPDNGRSNAPSVSDGKCSMVGDWDVTSTDGRGVPVTLSFDAAGNFVAHPPGSEVCSDTEQYGTYQLTPGLFELTSNVGLGQCAWWFNAGYQASFEDCDRLHLSNVFDNCTGGRGYLNGASLLVKR